MMIKAVHKVLLPVLFLFTFCRSSKPVAPIIEMKNESNSFAKTDTLLLSILNKYPEYFDAVLNDKKKLRLQIIYSQINRGANGVPTIVHHHYNVQPDLYFYPASTVKLPAAILSLQKLHELGIPGVDRNTTMITEAVSSDLPAFYNDPSTTDGRPTIANYIKKIFLVSDNNAYNRLYEFLGQEYFNTSLYKRGYISAQILHRLEQINSEDQSRTANPVSFYNGPKLLYQQPLAKSTAVFPSRKDLLGKGYIKGSELIRDPFDFSKKNKLTLPDLHAILQTLIFPESVSSTQRFNLSADDYSFLYKCMSTKPGESKSPVYDSSYTDGYVKFFLFGGNGKIDNPSLRIFNKVGDAYGFLQDVAYIVDFNKGIEFMLSATIYCNSDGILNDDKYDYDTVGFPFFKNLGQVIYNYELHRTKKVKPNLQKFRFDYRQ